MNFQSELITLTSILFLVDSHSSVYSLQGSIFSLSRIIHERGAFRE
jgi:hypothetical protein